MEAATRSRLTFGVMPILLRLVLFGMQYIRDVGGQRRPHRQRPSARRRLPLHSSQPAAGRLVHPVRSRIRLVGERDFYICGWFSHNGLGIGFILVHLVALLYQRRSHCWPLIPGTVPILLGLRSRGRVWRFLVSDGWPLILVIIGVLLLLGAVGKKRKPKTGSQREAAADLGATDR